jgi:beta-alanine--pyruvate transaminase
MSAVAVRKGIYDTMMDGPAGIELFHGYTYSAHPLACAAGLATLDVYAEEGLFARAAELAPKWEDAIHSLKGISNVIDIRNIGLMGAVELQSRDGAPGARAYDVFLKCFETGLMIRQAGESLAMSPPLIITEAQIDEIMEILGAAIKATD